MDAEQIGDATAHDRAMPVDMPEMTIVVGFSKGSSLFDRAIQTVEYGFRHHINAPLPLSNHCWVERRTCDQPALGIEAVWGGTRRFFAATKDATTEVVRRYEVDCTPEQVAAIWATLEGYVDRKTPYDKRGLLVSLWYVLTGRRKDRFNRDPKASIFCSSLIVSALRDADIPVEMEADPAPYGTYRGVPAGVISPARLEVWCLAHCRPYP